MALTPLGPKKQRKLERITGHTIVHASARNYDYFFTTAEHEHGWYDLKTDEWAIDPDAECMASCWRIFGAEQVAERMKGISR